MARPLRKKWACTNCGKVGDHGRRCVGIDKFYEQPQCSNCRSRYRKTIVVPTNLAALRSFYADRYPNDKAAMKRSWNFIAAKLSRKGFIVQREQNLTTA